MRKLFARFNSTCNRIVYNTDSAKTQSTTLQCSMSRAVRFWAVSTWDDIIMLNSSQTKTRRDSVCCFHFILSPVAHRPKSTYICTFELEAGHLNWLWIWTDNDLTPSERSMIQLPGCTVLWLWNSLLYSCVAVKYVLYCMYIHAVFDRQAPPKKS